jgi:hypothetical protein
VGWGGKRDGVGLKWIRCVGRGGRVKRDVHRTRRRQLRHAPFINDPRGFKQREAPHTQATNTDIADKTTADVYPDPTNAKPDTHTHTHKTTTDDDYV